jgi:hypothetical protein
MHPNAKPLEGEGGGDAVYAHAVFLGRWEGFVEGCADEVACGGFVGGGDWVFEVVDYAVCV